MTHEDVSVPKLLKAPKLFGDFVDRSGDQGPCRNTAIASVQHMFQHRLCLGRRLADVNVAPQGDGVWPPAVSGAALEIEIGCTRASERVRPGLAIQPSASRAARSMAGGALAPIQTSTGSAGRSARLASATRNRREVLTVSPANSRRTMSTASSNAEGRVRMLAPIAANRASPQPSPHCMIKGPCAIAASVPI